MTFATLKPKFYLNYYVPYSVRLKIKDSVKELNQKIYVDIFVIIWTFFGLIYVREFTHVELEFRRMLTTTFQIYR